jgi:hypothetical protein
MTNNLMTFAFQVSPIEIVPGSLETPKMVSERSFPAGRAKVNTMDYFVKKESREKHDLQRV